MRKTLLITLLGLSVVFPAFASKTDLTDEYHFRGHLTKQQFIKAATKPTGKLHKIQRETIEVLYTNLYKSMADEYNRGNATEAKALRYLFDHIDEFALSGNAKGEKSLLGRQAYSIKKMFKKKKR